MKHLVSKLLAGGLTAGIVLIWWPSHYPTSGLEWLVARGVVATLGFELMFIAFTGVEDWALACLRRRTSRVTRRRERDPSAPRRARTSFVLAAGGAALALPVLALASSGAPRVDPAATPKRVVQPVREKVVRQVVVKRRVIHDEVVVPSSSSQTPAATSSAPAKHAATFHPAKSQTTRQTAPTKTKAPPSTTTTSTTTPTTTSTAATPAPTTTTETSPATDAVGSTAATDTTAP